MICPGCQAVTHKFVAATISGKEVYACPSCQDAAPQTLKKKFIVKSSPTSRRFERYELPKDVRHATQKYKPSVKAPDSPRLRDIADVNKAKQRLTVFEMGDTPKSSRNERVMKKLTAKLGPNPKILKDDGFEVLAEAANG